MTQVVVGLGLTHSATIEQVRTSIDESLALLGLTWDAVAMVATTERRRDHPVVHQLTTPGGTALVLFEPTALAPVTVPNPSAAVGARAGTTSVAEAAALLAAGTDVLLLPKRTGPGVTVALAEVTQVVGVADRS
ncbi:MAG: cobalamin biosynthesis protein [Aquihabitans sp.]